ncbi:MAG: hypothetical protein M3O25_11160 [Actinomycetota bacterium]|nr:hypothetical protein [Actinomycetota bacterium]
MALGDGIKRLFRDVAGPPTKDGVAELKIGDASYDDWEVVRDFGELEAARAWRQQLTDQGLDAVITADHALDEWGRGDIALRVPPGRWSEAEEMLGEQ